MEYILEEQRPIGNLMITVGYILALLGGLLGLLIGNHILTSYIAGRGEKIPKYDEHARYHGKIITAIAMVMVIVALCLNMALKV